MFECARYLDLGGFSKIGYPGITLIEGDKLKVLEFVNRVQRLRWKHMVVRGEEIQQLHPDPENVPGEQLISEGDACDLIDKHRKFPILFFGEVTDTSEAAGICEKFGCKELFLTAMKIYNSSAGSNVDT